MNGRLSLTRLSMYRSGTRQSPESKPGAFPPSVFFASQFIVRQAFFMAIAFYNKLFKTRPLPRNSIRVKSFLLKSKGCLLHFDHLVYHSFFTFEYKPEPLPLTRLFSLLKWPHYKQLLFFINSGFLHSLKDLHVFNNILDADVRMLQHAARDTCLSGTGGGGQDDRKRVHPSLIRGFLPARGCVPVPP